MFYTGISHKIGEVHEGEAVMDWMEQERERGITIQSAATTCFWDDHQVNIIDTPGHVDFTIEVERSLRVLDGVVAVFCGVAGVQTQSETVWRQTERYNVPRIIFVNKLDRVGGSFTTVIKDIREKFKSRVVPMQIQVGEAENFKGVIDVLTNRFATFEGGDSKIGLEWSDVPEEYVDEAAMLREEVIEYACEADDALAEKFLNEEELSLQEIKDALRKGVINRDFSLAFCGTAFKNKGVQLLLDAVVDYLPSPLDVPPVEGEIPNSDKKELRKSDPTDPFCALAFKIVTDPFVGTLNFIRVYSGTLKAGSYVFNARTGAKERVSRLLKMHSNKREEIASVSAGDIAAVIGVKETITGDTLCEAGKMILLEPIHTPNPVISTSVEAKNKADYEKMMLALNKMMREDPSFTYTYNKETGQTEISGMGELHLEIIVDRLKREHKVEAVQGKLKVAYKETIQTSSDVEGKYIKQSGGRGQYGHVWMKFEPLERGSGCEFENAIVGGTIPREFIPGVEKGFNEAVNTGVLGGYPVVDIKGTLYDGSYHDVDSSEVAFKVAASMAFKKGMSEAKPVLLEPIMKVEVDTPEEYMGDVMGDLNSRRGRILGMEEKGGRQVINAEVPLGEMFGYATEVRAMSQGRAGYSMEFECYREVPEHAQSAILKDK